jgi:TonB family protein
MNPNPPNANSINPVFPGGATALQRYVQQETRQVATTASGTVFVQFVVNADGTIGDPVILKGLDVEADQEAIRVVVNMPAWIPGTANGGAARFTFVLPIDFAERA